MKVLVTSNIFDKSEEEVQKERKDCIEWLVRKGHKVVQSPLYYVPDEKPRSVRLLVIILNLMADVDAIIQVARVGHNGALGDFVDVLAEEYKLPSYFWDITSGRAYVNWEPCDFEGLLEERELL
jgi:hypothetical protein